MKQHFLVIHKVKSMFMHLLRPARWAALVALSLLVSQTSVVSGQSLTPLNSVEGITEYRLPNGVKLLLFPDDSKPQFTVNMTVMVGSRHEGYGESGMAHLLEHMLFRGTDRHPDIPKLLKERGVLNMNGTTSLDRTNYFETLPASSDNLDFAIGMEADRLINSWIRQEHLSNEMTIVRSEFERGENSPVRILFQRITDAAFQWHNYGKSTIGNQSDIMRVPAKNLRVFYEKYYQPDNVTVVIAGKFDRQEALDLMIQHFGSIPKPTRKLPKTYTEEPAQDGERVVTLRRTGDVKYVGLGYHVPSASNAEYPSIQVLSSILSNRPIGPLHKKLVKTGLASSAAAFARVGYDPGLMMAFAEVPKDKDINQTKETLINEIEGISADSITDEDVKRAVRRLLKTRESQFANSERFATAISEWESYGDWRLFFLHRDRLEKVTAEEVLAVAQKYLISSNRTVGMFLPTEKPTRVAIEGQNLATKMVRDYEGRKKIAEGEAFDPTPANIQARTKTGELTSGIKYALLSKETRGDRVTAQISLSYGDAESLKGMNAAAQVLPSLMQRGTKSLGYQEYRDRLDELKATVNITGTLGRLNVSILTEREFLVDTLDVVKQALQEPLLDESEFDVLKLETLTSLETGLSDPQTLAFNEMQRSVSPYTKGDVRYVPTVAESIQQFRDLKCDDIGQLHGEFIGGQYGELAVVGDFDADQVLTKLNQVFADWKAQRPFTRIEREPNLAIKNERIVIDTPDKKNAVFITARSCEVGDQHPDYEAMLIGDYIMGGGPLSSRIADRVRKQDGLSYTAITRFSGSSEDDRGTFFVFCISKPTNTERVASTVAEEVDLMLSTGVKPQELAQAKESYLKNRQGGRARESRLAGDLISNLRLGRTMDFQQLSDEKIASLTKEEVDAALRKVMDPQKMVIITAGDFSQPAESEPAMKDK